MKSKIGLFPPLVFNVFKPAGMSSYDVVRHFKRNLPNGFGKIGHFGTLDPFACGVLMIGISGAARLNDFIHDELPKTYLAVGKLGLETPTGDHTSEPSQIDDSLYLKQEIASFSRDFIEERLREKFLGDYWQAPHKYSAAKFEGRNLHEWARDGIEVKKEPVLRKVHHIEVVRYVFPYLSVRVAVSSGTYVRTLFSDMARYLGTLGSLIALVRESVGEVSTSSALKLQGWPKGKEESFLEQGIRIDRILPFPQLELDASQVTAFRNGAFLKNLSLGESEYYWIISQEGALLGLAQKFGEEIRPKINFHLVDQ